MSDETEHERTGEMGARGFRVERLSIGDWPDTSKVHEAYYRTRAPEHFRRCDYCGSIHPQDLLVLQHNIQIIDIDRSVDWKYGWPHKIYVDVANPEPDTLFAVGGLSEATKGPYAPGGEHYRPPEPGYVRETELTTEQLEIVRRDGMMSGEPSPRRYILFGHRAVFHGKFYSVHTLEPWLLDDQRDKLFALVGYRFEWAEPNNPIDGRIRYTPYDPA